MNQYNRKRLIQSKIKYQPIDITFHDDNASQITAMWDAYYRYNYADAWNPIVDPLQSSNSNQRDLTDVIFMIHQYQVILNMVIGEMLVEAVEHRVGRRKSSFL